MYDFRQKRRPTRVKLRSAHASKRVIQQRVTRKKVIVRRAPITNESPLMRFFKTTVSIFIGILLIAVCAYFFVTKIATYIWPLTSLQTLLLVPTMNTPQLPWIQVVVLDPTTQTAQVAELSQDVALTNSGQVLVGDLSSDLNQASSSGAVSLKLGRVIDDIVLLPGDEPLRTHADARHVFQELIGQETPGVSSGDKIRWWLFILSLSDSNFRVKNSANYSAWQSWLANLSQQQPTVRCSLALINTTNTSGLSRFLSQIMEQSGYQVIKVDSQPKLLERSQVFINPERLGCQNAAQRLEQFLPNEIEVVPDAQITQQARADIVWLLGSDVAQQAQPLLE